MRCATPGNSAARARPSRPIFPGEIARPAGLPCSITAANGNTVIASGDRWSRRQRAPRRNARNKSRRHPECRAAARSLHAPHLIPADVRRFHVCRQRANFVREKSEARFARSFLARCEHRLQAEANAENRHAESYAVRSDEVGCVRASPATKAEKWPTPGSTITFADAPAAARRSLRLRAQLLQSALDRRQDSPRRNRRLRFS